jgi:hypothetical protein
MQPQKSVSHIVDDAEIQKANSLALIIENSILNFAQSVFSFKTTLERYTELIWYCKVFRHCDIYGRC